MGVKVDTLPHPPLHADIRRKKSKKKRENLEFAKENAPLLFQKWNISVFTCFNIETKIAGVDAQKRRI